MKKASPKRSDDLRPEYDLKSLSGRIRGKYHRRYSEGTNVVLLEPDVAEAFRSSKAVNEALRMLLSIASKTTKTRPPSRKRRA
jgi:hypothetical protein